jgi:hypothetical protein
MPSMSPEVGSWMSRYGPPPFQTLSHPTRYQAAAVPPPTPRPRHPWPPSVGCCPRPLDPTPTTSRLASYHLRTQDRSLGGGHQAKVNVKPDFKSDRSTPVCQWHGSFANGPRTEWTKEGVTVWPHPSHHLWSRSHRYGALDIKRF